jgi:hypothetical protein
MAVDLIVIPRSFSSSLERGGQEVSDQIEGHEGQAEEEEGQDGPGVHEPGVTGLGRGDDTGLGDERVGEGRLSVVD